MAPESERAKMCGMLATVNGVKMACSQLEGHGNFHTLAPEQPDEPTLTCSEVVERLATGVAAELLGWHTSRIDVMLSG
jgi:hypothetical protein